MKILLLLFTAFFTVRTSFSQGVKEDSLSAIQVKNAVDLYNRFNAGNAPVYNGIEYLYYTFKMEGNPFFESGEDTYGWVHYEGRKYDSLLLMFDLSRNQLVITGPNKTSRIVLHNELVDSFSLRGHTFISLQEDHSQNLYNTGFYDLLYNGHTRFLARRSKTMNPKIQSNVLVTYFYPSDHFYVQKDGLYYLVGNRKDVFRLFKGKTHEIKKMIRKNHLKFRRRYFENSMVKVAAFYDQLTH